MNFYPFHIGDYASHTRHLSLMEDLAYRRLLDLYYTTERALNGSSTDVARRIGMLAEQGAVEYVLKEFFEPLEDGSGYQNKRCDEEIAKFTAKKVQASQAGKASAERRFNARSTDVQPTKNQEPRTNNQEKNLTTTAAAEKTRRQPVKKIAFDLETGAFQGITVEDELRWQDAYPAVPIPPEISRAAAWLKANPANKKSNCERFLVNWFSRAQDKAARVR